MMHKLTHVSIIRDNFICLQAKNLIRHLFTFLMAAILSTALTWTLCTVSEMPVGMWVISCSSTLVLTLSTMGLTISTMGLSLVMVDSMLGLVTLATSM